MVIFFRKGQSARKGFTMKEALPKLCEIFKINIVVHKQRQNLDMSSYVRSPHSLEYDLTLPRVDLLRREKNNIGHFLVFRDARQSAPS